MPKVSSKVRLGLTERQVAKVREIATRDREIKAEQIARRMRLTDPPLGTIRAHMAVARRD